MGKRAKAEKPAIRHAAQTEEEALLPLRPFPDELFRWCLGNDKELYLKFRRHAPDRRTVKAGPLWKSVPRGASLTVKGRSKDTQRIHLQTSLVTGLGLLRERKDMRFELAGSFALGYERANHAQRFILLACPSVGGTFEQYIESFIYGAFPPKHMRFGVDIATKQQIQEARSFDPYCGGTGYLPEADCVMRFNRIRIWHEWATLKLEPCSGHTQPNVFFEPPRPLLHGYTLDQKKAGRWAFYLYSDSLGNIVFEVVPLVVQYALGEMTPKEINFDPDYLSRISAMPAFPIH